jgi:hypothetical protein
MSMDLIQKAIATFREKGKDADVFAAIFDGDGSSFFTNLYDEEDDDWVRVKFDDVADAMDATIKRGSDGDYIYRFRDGSAIVVAESGGGWWIDGEEDA